MFMRYLPGKVMRASLVFAVVLQISMPAAQAAERFVFISHAADSDLSWTPVKNSLKHAAEDFGVSVDYKNPKNGDIEEMARIIDESAAQKYDGMIVTIADYEILKPHLAAVVEKAHIPLITVNSGSLAQSESVGALLHVGQPDHFAGLAAGEKAKAAGIKTFVCLVHHSANRGSNDRCQGFADGLGMMRNYDELKLSGDERAMQNAIASYLQANKETEAILALGPVSAHPALAAIKDGKLAKTPYFVTFDLSNPISEGLRKGTIAFALDQQPYLQGYLSVGILANRRAGGGNNLPLMKTVMYSNPKLHTRMASYGLSLLTFGKRHINSGPALITKENVDKVESFSGTYR